MRRYRRRTPQQAALIGHISEPVQPVVFDRQALLRLEIGFGHGEFLRQLAATHPDEDHIGIEFNPTQPKPRINVNNMASPTSSSTKGMPKDLSATGCL